MRQFYLTLSGKQRIPKRAIKSSLPDALVNCKEWWCVEAPNIASARALVALWPNRTSDSGLNARVIHHARNH